MRGTARDPPGAGNPSRAGALALLAAAGLLAELGWLIVAATRRGVSEAPSFTAAQAARLGPLQPLRTAVRALVAPFLPNAAEAQPSVVAAHSVVVGLAVVTLAYFGALFLLHRFEFSVASVRGVVFLGAVVFEATLLVMPDILSTDVFSYALYGRIGGIYAHNPYLVAPNHFPDDPVLRWIYPAWHGLRTPYGPLWTDLSAALAWLTRGLDPVVQALSFKGLMAGVHLLNAALVTWLAPRLTGRAGRASVAALALYAWNPLVLLEAAGSGHNDALVATLLLLALACLVTVSSRSNSRALDVRWLASLACLVLGALLKYVPLVLLPLWLAVWWRQTGGGYGLLLRAAATAALALTLFLLAAWPWLTSFNVVEAMARSATAEFQRYYVNSLVDIPAAWVAAHVLDRTGSDVEVARALARTWFLLASRVLLAGYLVAEIGHLWRTTLPRELLRPQLLAAAATRTLVLTLLLGVPQVRAWYFIWPVAIAALLGWSNRLARVAILLSVTFLFANYLRRFGLEPLPNLLLVGYVALPLTYGLADWALARHRLRLATASAV